MSNWVHLQAAVALSDSRTLFLRDLCSCVAGLGCVLNYSLSLLSPFLSPSLSSTAAISPSNPGKVKCPKACMPSRAGSNRRREREIERESEREREREREQQQQLQTLTITTKAEQQSNRNKKRERNFPSHKRPRKLPLGAFPLPLYCPLAMDRQQQQQ